MLKLPVIIAGVAVAVGSGVVVGEEVGILVCVAAGLAVGVIVGVGVKLLVGDGVAVGSMVAGLKLSRVGLQAVTMIIKNKVTTNNRILPHCMFFVDLLQQRLVPSSWWQLPHLSFEGLLS